MGGSMRKPARILACVASVTVLAAILFAWGICGWWPIPSIRGRIDAKIDVAHKQYRQLGYGRPFRGADEYARLLQQQYGVDFHYAGYCTVSRSLMDYADAYNEVSTVAAINKFGRDIFKDSYDQAVKDWDLKNGTKPAN